MDMVSIKVQVFLSKNKTCFQSGPSINKTKIRQTRDMSLVPIFGKNYYYQPVETPLDQHFGVPLQPDYFHPFSRRFFYSPSYLKAWRPAGSEEDTGSTMIYDKNKFEAHLDVKQFRPEEVSVKVVENTIVVEGKHEEKNDDHGKISRHFVRKYLLPKEYDLSNVESELSSDGVLSIRAPIDEKLLNKKNIPIAETGKPRKDYENSFRSKL